MNEQEKDRALRKRVVIKSNGEERIVSNGVNEGSEKPHLPDEIIRGMSELNVREHIERLRSDFVNHVNDQFDDMVSTVIKNFETTKKFEGSDGRRLEKITELYSDKRKPSKPGALAEKEFLPRNSVLTDLYEIKHFRTIFHVFTVILIILSLHTVLYDWLHTGSVHLGSKLIRQGFAKFSTVIEIWLVMIASTFAVYSVFNFWAQRRLRMTPNSFKITVWDYGWIVLFVAYQLALLTLPTLNMISLGLPPMSRVVILTEQVRMVMKIHAFVRTTVPVVMSQKPHSDRAEFKFPNFMKFLYFMFAPTLIYRDSYPRTKEIRWGFALWHFFEVILVIFNMAVTFERHLLPPFKDFGQHPVDIRSVVLNVWSTFFPSLLIFLSGFYCLLHAWSNATAEVMRFADRLFYKDWWNATTYASFYRRWNIIVHDWLYTYIYKDMYEIVTPGNRYLSICAVFFVSALFHEFIIAFTFTLLFPLLMIQFGVIGLILVFILRTGRPWGNVFLWFSLCTGSGVLISLYSMEYFARINCPRDDGITDLILPKMFTCF